MVINIATAATGVLAPPRWKVQYLAVTPMKTLNADRVDGVCLRI
jgi:hypothetical protein